MRRRIEVRVLQQHVTASVSARVESYHQLSTHGLKRASRDSKAWIARVYWLGGLGMRRAGLRADSESHLGGTVVCPRSKHADGAVWCSTGNEKLKETKESTAKSGSVAVHQSRFTPHCQANLPGVGQWTDVLLKLYQQAVERNRDAGIAGISGIQQPSQLNHALTQGLRREECRLDSRPKLRGVLVLS